MASIDIFKGDAFSMQELTAALERVPYTPGFLGSLGIFEPKPIRTEVFSIEQKDRTLSLVQTSRRGAPLAQRGRDQANIRDFRTVRVAKGDVVRASEIQNIRQFGSMTELVQVQSEVMDRMVQLRRDIDLTLEYHRLGAIQGVVTDADGTTTIRDWYAEFGLSADAEIDFDLDNATPASGAVAQKCKQVIRAIARAAKGSWIDGQSYVMALCGDTFFDQLVGHSEVRQTYLYTQQAGDLRNDVGKAFDSVRYGGITFVNYRGTDDNTTVAVGATKAKFFPVNAPGVFQWVQSPGESFDVANTPGLPFYALQVPDRDRNMFVAIEVYSYPMFLCTKPGMLQSGRNT